ncbi:MAG: hypothetical protein ACTMIA_04075 [Vibrio sp.]
MKYILPALTAAALMMSFTASAAKASDISIEVTARANQASIEVKESGQPLADYPVTVEGLTMSDMKTEDDGSLIIYNRSTHSKTVKLIVKDENGEKTTKEIFLGSKS